MLLALVGGLIAMSILYSQAEFHATQARLAMQRETEQRRDAEKAREAAVLAQAAAEREREEAKTQADIATTVSDFLRDALRSAKPTMTGGREVTVRSLLDHTATLLQGFHANPRVRASLRHTVAQSYLSLGRYREALVQLETAVALWQDAGVKLEGEVDPSLLRDMNGLAVVLANQKKHAEALALMRKVVALSGRVYGANSAEALAFRAHLASALVNAGHLGKADALTEKLLVQTRRHLGLTHRVTVLVMLAAARCSTIRSASKKPPS